ncbi:MAG TPA: winged helix-turn-helix domain-containing protein [Acetobacteraceae bacterium]|nr:winged helix-turn-helix domain-containing protein [Acetobacteraceae bacterium]
MFGPFRLFPVQRLLLEGDRAIRLGSRALDVLIALAERAGEVISKDELIARAWPGTVVEEGNLKVQVAALRRALGDGSGGKRYLTAVPGRGYCLVAAAKYETVEGTPHEAGPSEAGPAAPAHNLPVMLTRLVGRAEEVAALAARLPGRRLLTLVGPGGIGKTSVALAVAEARIARYADGVWLVDLTPLGDARLVPTALATPLGLEIGSDNPLPGLINALRDRRMLVVLDNCEHVIDGAAHLAAGLLRGTRGVDILATSREPLRVQGEQRYRLAPLDSPPTSEGLIAIDATAFPAVQLFVERATESSHDFVLDDADVPVVADICRKLDGIPLAIELAAARVDALGVRELASRLDDRLRFLTHGRRTGVARHQTMRAALDWSYGVLSEGEQNVLRRLAVFAGGFTLEAAAAVGGNGGAVEREIADRIEELVAKSLVVADVHGAAPRYRLLETTRAYGLEKLNDSGELAVVTRRHAEYYRDLLAAAGDPEDEAVAGSWHAIYAPEVGNVRAALDWAFGPTGDAETAVAIAAASASLWIEMSLLTECRGWMEAAVSRLDDAAATGTRREMIVQAALGLSVMYTRGRTNTPRAALARANELAERYQDPGYQLRTITALALFCIRLEDFEGALKLARRAEAIAKSIADEPGVAKVNCISGLALFFLGKFTEALPNLRAAYSSITPVGRRAQIVRSGMDYSILARCVEAHILWLHGTFDRSAQAARDVLADAQETGHPASLCQALAWCGCGIPLQLGDLDTAEHSIALLKNNARTHGFSYYYAFGLGYEGQLSALRGDIEGAERLLRAGLEEMREYENIYTAFLIMLAAVLASASKFSESFAVIDEVLRRTASNEGFAWRPEALRIRGDVRLLSGTADAAAAEKDFRGSLDLARRQETLSWELRTVTSLARLWRDQGLRREARELLASTYDRFSEGFQTADLKAAKLLLDELT